MTETEKHTDHATTYTNLCRCVSVTVRTNRGFLLDRKFEDDDRFSEHGARLLDRSFCGQGDVGDYVFHASVVGKTLEVRANDSRVDPRSGHDPVANPRRGPSFGNLFFTA